MGKDTVEFIKELLKLEVASRKHRMMDCIDNGFDAYIKDRINDYRNALNALNDFIGWEEDQEFAETAE